MSVYDVGGWARRYKGGSDLPNNLVELMPTDIRISGDDHYIGLESLYRDIIASGVEVWRPTISNIGVFKRSKSEYKGFVVKQEVADAVEMWLNRVNVGENGEQISGYANMSLREYIQKVFADGEEKQKEE